MSFNWGLFSHKQLDVIANSTARINILDGSVRSGKTIASLVAWIMFVSEAPPGELLMVGKTERTLKRNILDVLEQIVGSRYFKYNLGAGEATLFGRRIYLVGANDLRSEGKIRGLTLAGAYGDEIALWPESFFTMLLSRLSVPGARFIGTTNPDSPYHWLKTSYLDRVGELGLRRWHFSLEDNPNLDPAYVEALKKEYVGLWYKRFISGLWVQAEGAVYDMWDDAIYAVDEVPSQFTRYYVGVDYGTSNPTVFLLIGQHEDKIYVIDEYYWDSAERGRQKTDAEYSRDLREFIKGRYPQAIVIDPSATSFITQLRRDGVRMIRHANNSVLDGIRTVAAFLPQKRLFVYRERCSNLLREFTAYVWDPQAQKRGEDRPLKQNDHALDALRYVVHTVFGRLAPGVLSKPKGW